MTLLPVTTPCEKKKKRKRKKPVTSNDLTRPLPWFYIAHQQPHDNIYLEQPFCQMVHNCDLKWPLQDLWPSIQYMTHQLPLNIYSVQLLITHFCRKIQACKYSNMMVLLTCNSTLWIYTLFKRSDIRFLPSTSFIFMSIIYMFVS